MGNPSITHTDCICSQRSAQLAQSRLDGALREYNPILVSNNREIVSLPNDKAEACRKGTVLLIVSHTS